MNAVKDQALCIRRINYSESSQIVTLFGRENGKVRAIAKGSRRGKSKFGGGIDLLNVGEIIYHRPRGDSDLATLAEFNLSESFSLLRQNLLALTCAQFAADRLAEFSEDNDPNPDLFDNFLAALGQWEHSPRPDQVLVKLELVLLHTAGLLPGWSRCAACKKNLQTGRSAYFSSQAGGMICRDCEGAVSEKTQAGPTTWGVLGDIGKLGNTSRTETLAIHELLCYHQREILGKQPQIMSFLLQLLRQNARSNKS